MITLAGEDKPSQPLRIRLVIAAFVIAGIFVPGMFLTAKSGEGFVMDFIGGLVVALPALALSAFLLKKVVKKYDRNCFVSQRKRKRNDHGYPIAGVGGS